MPQRASAGRIELKPTQERVLAALRDEGSLQVTRGRYEEIAGVSRSQAAYDLAELVEAGILERIGGGRATRYRLARRDRPGQRVWTNDRIRSSLRDFCTGRETWPSAREFKAAGHTDLYVAASRYGGIGFWATELGFPRPGRAAPPQAPHRSWRPKLRWAAAGAGLAAVLFSAAGAALYGLQNGPSRKAAVGQRAHHSPITEPSSTRTGTGQRAVAAKTNSQPGRTSRRVVRSASTGGSSRTYASGYRTELAVQRVSTPTRVAVSTTREQPAQPTAGAAGPAPLPAPASAPAPAPIPAPHR